MSPASYEREPSESGLPHDNLEEIKGIGKTYASALQSLGIHRFADLAQYTPRALSRLLLTRANKRIDPEKIESEGWIEQANALMQQQGAATPSQAPDQTTDVIVVKRGDIMDSIEMQRGGRNITFHKAPDRFAVRLDHGRAANEAALESSLGQPLSPVRHLDSISSEDIDIFTVDDPSNMEATVDKLRESPAADIVSHVYTLDEKPGSEVVPTGILTIQFKPDTPQEKCEAILIEFGLEVLRELNYLPNGYTVQLTTASTENPLKIAAQLQERPEIEVAEPDLGFKAALQYAPSDPLYKDQWHLNNEGGYGLKAGADVKAEQAWDITSGCRNITICIIDDGFDLKHPEFDYPDKIVSPRDFGQGDFDPSPVSSEDKHGTACAGVALAEENGVGVVGLAHQCAFMPLRMSSWLTDEAVADYFNYAVDHAADVISCSWSAKVWDFPLSTKMNAVIHYAATAGRNGKGCVILFAAGNEDRPLDGEKNGYRSVQGFALHPDVIAVGASNSRDERSHYSNFGPELTLCAPSSGAGGRRIVTTDWRGIRGYSYDDYTDTFGGTSSSTPLAAGLAALILCVNENLTAYDVRKIMTETADRIDQENGRYVNGRSPCFGYGRINAHRAVTRALASERDAPTLGESSNVAAVVAIDGFELSSHRQSTHAAPVQLVAEVTFQVTPNNGTEVAPVACPYQVDVFFRNRVGGDVSQVASEQGDLPPHQRKFTSRLVFSPPIRGEYESEVHVHVMLPSGQKSAYNSGRNVRII